MQHESSFEQFLQLSAVLTGFNRAELLGTGMAHSYYDELVSLIGAPISAELFLVAAHILPDETKVRTDIIDSPKYGPLTLNMIRMWYLGQWNQLPADWRNTYEANANDLDHVVSSQAYQQGLVWTAIGSHPMAAKQPGYGTWRLPPRI